MRRRLPLRHETDMRKYLGDVRRGEQLKTFALIELFGRRPLARGATVMGPGSENLHTPEIVPI